MVQVNGVSVAGEILVDARGHRCPTPTLRLQRALRSARPGQRVRLLADDPMAMIDVPHFLQTSGGKLVESSAEDGVLSFLIEAP
ncbi:MAG TPA: sulfurtransferase TusA family protein [Caulobacteraceae bacterium]